MADTETPEVEVEIPKGEFTFASALEKGLITDAEPEEEAEETEETEKPGDKKPITEEKKPDPAKPVVPKETEKTETTEEEKKETGSTKFSIPGAEEKPADTTAADGTKPAAAPAVEKQVTLEDVLKDAPKKDVFKALKLTQFQQDFIDFTSNGGDPLKYIEAKARDWNKVADIDVLRHQLKKENAGIGLDDSDLELLVNRELQKYNVDGDASENDKRIAQVMLKKDAHIARQKEITEQAKFTVPAAQAVDNNKSQEPTAQEVWSNEFKASPVTKSLLQSKKVVMSGGKEGYEHTFALDNPEELVKLWTDSATYGKYMLDKSGKPNVEKQNLMAMMAINPQLVINSLIDQGREMQKQAAVTDKQKLDKKEVVVPSGTGKKSISKAFAEDGKDMKMGDL